ncbi:hypothetical protein CBS101457_005772 [Exobasidium rhododendri]|nr:hypothetical protein CBS101457_005772 [Exobasidium rhododendri]
MTIRSQDVVCAFILPQETDAEAGAKGEFKLLCAQRPDDAEYFPSLYEFVGGKVEQDEHHHSALIREVKEELDVRIEVIQSKAAFTFHHPPKLDKKSGGQVLFQLYFYWARLLPNLDGSAPNPKALASQKVVWLTPQEMGNVSFCSGDEDIIAALGKGTLRPGMES